MRARCMLPHKASKGILLVGSSVHVGASPRSERGRQGGSLPTTTTILLLVRVSILAIMPRHHKHTQLGGRPFDHHPKWQTTRTDTHQSVKWESTLPLHTFVASIQAGAAHAFPGCVGLCIAASLTRSNGTTATHG